MSESDAPRNPGIQELVSCRFLTMSFQDMSSTGILDELGIEAGASSIAYTSWEARASTLPTRFPAALGIGHGSALRASLMHSH